MANARRVRATKVRSVETGLSGILRALRQKNRHILRGPEEGEQGYTMAFVVLAGLIIVVSSVMLAGRSNFSSLGSNRQLQYSTAKEAAEFGFSQLISQLNKDENGYLLVTNWSSWQGTTALPSGTSTGCDVSILNSNVRAQAIAGVSSNSTPANQFVTLPGNSRARYQLVNYTAPRAVNAVCGMGADGSARFGNLFGGDAKLEVRGQLLDASNNVLSTQTISRKVHVKIMPVGMGTSSFLVTGPPNTSQVNALNLWYDTNANGSQDTGEPWIDIWCVQCTGTTQAALKAELGITTSGGNAYAGTIYAGPYSFGNKKQQVDALRSSLASLVSSGANLGPVNLPHYPYNSNSYIDSNLRSECRAISGEIACRIGTINLNPRTITVQTGQKVVNLFIEGSTVSLGTGRIINSNTLPDAWKRLNVYGVNNGTSSCSSQTFTTTGGFGMTNMFIWIPNATLDVGGGGGGLNFRGVLWGCSYDGNSSNSLTFVGADDAAQAVQALSRSFVPVGSARYRAQGVMEPN
jgi:hypothetical protein